ncbi:hypothetical protein LY625_06040 [Lysobacter sp. GX 14042]|uniref:hypothetical protein n=1 Tax=Lysobacter sp. GX 14042 TaxID=2907155 RepID=UPI001F16D79F|nr:hypothetical protein [Lysobacter sp. GX 14042]MCE7032181.1 hypothetical protein [Lysobacter sp. GX 14042]
MRLIKLLLLASVIAVTACATGGSASDALEKAQYAWSGAIRWGDFAGARNLVDPEVRQARPLSELELARYEQVQVSSYRSSGASTDIDAGIAVREVRIGVINRHTMAEREVSYREQWRWDDQARTWWLTSDLPDLWGGN